MSKDIKITCEGWVVLPPDDVLKDSDLGSDVPGWVASSFCETSADGAWARFCGLALRRESYEAAGWRAVRVRKIFETVSEKRSGRRCCG